MNKKKLTIYFTDFWPNFMPKDNYFYNLLSNKYELVLDSKKPDILFHSADYSNNRNHLKYNNGYTKKIFFTGEDIDPTCVDTHFSFSFKENSANNYRLPLWTQYINWFEKKYNKNRDPAYLIPKDSLLKSRKLIKSYAPFFCSFIASKPMGKRVDFVPKLNDKIRVHNLGRLYANSYITSPGRGDQRAKLNLMRLFKFNIAFENSVSDGYVTEKILHSLFSNSIPIYWGASQAQRDFNPNSFINLGDFKDDDSLIDYLHNNYTDKTFRLNYLNEPVFKNNQIPDFVKPENVLSVLSEIIE
ncbi:glycosyltransferase family 10 [Acidimicrobiia bacterium]|nr:glycosyltransferase family 10 [Acidimicrobiia bacterium]